MSHSRFNAGNASLFLCVCMVAQLHALSEQENNFLGGNTPQKLNLLGFRGPQRAKNTKGNLNTLSTLYYILFYTSTAPIATMNQAFIIVKYEFDKHLELFTSQRNWKISLS